MATIKVSDEVKLAVEKFASKKGITEQEAGDRLVGTGISRLAALARYAKAQGEEKPAPKKKAKAKGPIARKAKKEKSETPEQSAAAAS